MSATLLHDNKRTVFALVPPRGPISLLLRSGAPTPVYDALRQIRPALEEQRGDRGSIPVAVSMAESALPDVNEERMVGLLIKALGMSGLTCVGFVAGSPSAQALADWADLVVVPAALGCSQVDLGNHSRAVDERVLREEEAIAWDEAIAFNAKMDLEREARDWEQALIDDRAFEAQKEAERLEAIRLKEEEAQAWEEALVHDAEFEREREAKAWAEAIAENARIDAEHELLAWEEALAEDRRRTLAAEAARQERLRRQEQEARAWEEAIAMNEARDTELFNRAWEEALREDALRTRAEEAARATREAILTGKPLPVSVLQDPESTPAQEVQATDVSADLVNTIESMEESEEADVEDDEAVATQVREEVSRDVAVVPAALIHRERVRSGCQVYAKGTDLMVFGNVSSGAEIIADGSINAYAPVYGRIIAGAKGNKQAHVVCQHFYAEIVSIGGGFITSDELPDDLRGSAVHFWHEDDGIHFRRLPAASIPVVPL